MDDKSPRIHCNKNADYWRTRNRITFFGTADMCVGAWVLETFLSDCVVANYVRVKINYIILSRWKRYLSWKGVVRVMPRALAAIISWKRSAAGVPYKINKLYYPRVNCYHASGELPKPTELLYGTYARGHATLITMKMYGSVSTHVIVDLYRSVTQLLVASKY